MTPGAGLTAAELKRWLYREISKDAAWHEIDAEQLLDDRYYRTSAEAQDRLANFVQQLPDDDERLLRLAAAYPEHRTLEDLPISGNLHMRIFEFVQHGDPDRFLNEYVELEVSQLTGRYRINLGD